MVNVMSNRVFILISAHQPFNWIFISRPRYYSASLL